MSVPESETESVIARALDTSVALAIIVGGVSLGLTKWDAKRFAFGEPLWSAALAVGLLLIGVRSLLSGKGPSAGGILLWAWPYVQLLSAARSI